MLEEVNEIMEAILKDDKMLNNVAKMMKKLYDELIDVGFTEDQAARIVANYKAT